MKQQEIEIIPSHRHKKIRRNSPSRFIAPLALIVWPWLALPVIFLLYVLSNLTSLPEFIRIMIGILLFIIGFATIVISLPSFVIGIILFIVRYKKI